VLQKTIDIARASGSRDCRQGRKENYCKARNERHAEDDDLTSA